MIGMSDSKRYSLIAFSGDMWSLYKSNMKGMIYFVRIKRFQNRKKSIYSTLLIRKKVSRLQLWIFKRKFNCHFNYIHYWVYLCASIFIHSSLGGSIWPYILYYTCASIYIPSSLGVPSDHIYYSIPVHPYTSPPH